MYSTNDKDDIYTELAVDSMLEAEEYLEHYGTPRHSGRYPWGSGKNPQHNKDLSVRAKELRDKGMGWGDAAKELGYKSSSELRAAITMNNLAKERDRNYKILKLADKGYSNSAIVRKLGVTEGTVRNVKKSGSSSKNKAVTSCVEILKNQMASGDWLDVSKGSNLYFGVSDHTLDTALNILRHQGYEVRTVAVEQLGTREKTNTKVLVPKNVTAPDIHKNLDKVKPPQNVGQYVDKDTQEIKKLHAPKSIDSKRVLVRYNEEGGKDRDGTIQLRRGVDDLDLGNSRYAQVRIEVDGTHYLKGMATYADDIPKGYDIVFNTNKHVGTPKMDVFKPIKDDIDPLNRFGALIDRQNDYVDAKGEEQHGALNIVRGEGEWGEWSKSIASQMLSKQTPNLAKKQLNIDYKSREDEYNEIMSMTNPTVRKKLLEDFAETCDGAAVHLKAAAFPRQGYHVILPLPGIKENEIYAPNYEPGEKVVLIRYPHGGLFEIPELTVNNQIKEGKSILGEQARDAVGIHPKVAEQLSGADFDGDTVLVIPNNSGEIKTRKAIKDLVDFEPKDLYKKGDDEVPTKGHFDTQREMGMISNLINDMTLEGAPIEDIVRATRHSMVVIDAEKHNLDARASARNENIQELKDLYQSKGEGVPGGGASTLISRAKSQERIPERKQLFTLKDPETGEYIVKNGIEIATGKLMYQETGGTHNVWEKNKDGTLKRDADGKPILKSIEPNIQTVRKMELAEDARELMSGPNHEGVQMERIYADYANKCKALANEARKSYVTTVSPKKDPAATKAYAEEVDSLKVKLANAQMNAPLERYAQRRANAQIKLLIEDDPSLRTREKADTLRKEKGKALQRGRREVGAKKKPITLTDREWEAIQAHAISPNMLEDILDNADMDNIRAHAMPKKKPAISATTKARIKAYASKGRTQAEIADALGLSTSTISEILAN